MSNDDYHKTIKGYWNDLRADMDAPGLESMSGGEQSLDETLAQLLNGNATSEDRTGALLWLKSQAFSHPSFAEWRPQFLDGLRSASDSENQNLREIATETLISYGDKATQQRILDGLTNQAEALVSHDFALRLLSQDSHSAAQEAARLHAEVDSDEVTRLEALRVLASDPNSVERFAMLLSDDSQSEAIRSLAATALSSLDRKRLSAVATEMATGTEALEAVAESNVDKHVRALLELQ